MARPAGGEVFRFKYVQDEKYRIITEVDENVYINGVFSHQANILNKIAVETLAVKDRAGMLSSSFQVSERIYGTQTSFVLTSDYHSTYWRDELGVYEIEPHHYMPSIRNVPLFLSDDIDVGTVWNNPGEEVHDFRRDFGIDRALRFPIQVTYTYLRNEDRDGKNLAVLKVYYTFFHRLEPFHSPSGVVPVKITGVSDQLHYWDNEAGRVHSYEERFDIILHLSNGEYFEFEGTAQGQLIPAPKMDREKMVEDLQKELKEKGIQDATVTAEEDGVTVTLQNIQFPPNSAYLWESELEKLKRIADILARYSQRDILITGHTARVGTEESSQVLSEQRAKAVGDYILYLGAVSERQLVTRGMGSREPLANNATEEGRRLNRRVELTILEN